MSSELFLSYNIVFLYGVLMIELVFLRDLECYLLKVEATGLYQSVCLEVIVPRMSRLACVSIQTISFNVLANLNFMDFNGYVLKTIVYSSPRVYCAIYVYVCKPEPSKLLDLFSFWYEHSLHGIYMIYTLYHVHSHSRIRGLCNTMSIHILALEGYVTPYSFLFCLLWM